MNCGEFLDELIDLKGRVAITHFGNLDPDVIASAFALGRLFEAKDVEYDFIVEGEITRPENQLLINYLGMSIKNLDESGFEDYSHVSLVGSNPGEFADMLDEKLREELEKKLISVQDNQDEGGPVSELLESKEVYLDIRPEYGACSTVLAECFDG